MIAADDRADRLDPEPVGDAQVAGLPASASRFSVRSLNEALGDPRHACPTAGRPAGAASAR